MKKIIASLVIGLLTFSSCSDFLEEENLSNVGTEASYTTPTGFEALVNGNYSQLREIYGNEPWLFVAGTDLYAEGRNTEPIGLAEYTQLTPSTSKVDYLYKQCYVAIQRANMGIYYAGKIKPSTTLSATTIAARQGELKFLRANAYFLLVQTYGGVSLITDYNPSPQLTFDRNSAQEVYAFIIKELEDSLAALSTTAYTGRVTKRAALDLLAKIYLTRGYESFAGTTDFAKAADYADQAIAGQALTLQPADLWKPGNDMNAETIFSVQFDASSVSSNPQLAGNAQGSYFSSYLGGSEVAGKAPYRTYTLLPTAHAIGLYEQGDKRWDATFMNTVYARYYDFFDVANKSTLKITHFYEPKWFTPADKTAYLATNAANLSTSPVFQYHAYGTYAAKAGLNSDYQTIPVKKFDDPKAPFATNAASPRVSTRDLVISRLSDAYLIAAEAYFKLGDIPTALARLNTVRTRAGVTLAVAGDLTIDYVLDERARELLGEYNRWFDLKRTGKLIERASLYNYKIQQSNFDGKGGEKKILRPIPQEAIDLNQNKNFPQNPAY
jgi:starch-binding outer membrane protein, SusD/RagB family